MATKVSPLAVIKESLKLFWNQKWIYLGLALAPFAAVAAMFVLNLAYMEQTARAGIGDISIMPLLMMLVVFVGMWTYTIIFNHYVITHLRGAPAFIPERLGHKLFRTLLLFLKFIGLTLVVTLPIMLVFLLCFGTSLKTASDGLILTIILLAFPLSVLCYIAALRVLMAFPGIAVGELYKIRDAWKLTKGHGFRMLLTFIIYLVPLIITEVAAGATDSPVLVLVVMFACQALLQILNIITTGVWYERLLPLYRDRLKNEAEPKSSGDEVADAL